MMSAAPVICLLGATATGKTALAFALAERFPVHLISVDSAQVYRGLDIGSAKPSPAELARYPHALIDILSPEDSYSAAKFCHDATAEIAHAHATGKIPLLVGGTMLYFYALFAGLADLPSADPTIRAMLTARWQEDGGAALFAELAQRDPRTAAQISPNDQQRIVRFLELCYCTGQTPSELFAAQKSARPPWSICAFGLTPARATLHERIAQRFRTMIAAGFIDEVARLKARPELNLTLPALKSVGYRQIWQHLDGELSRAEAIERGIIATRQLAKRQTTWLNNRLARVLPMMKIDPLESTAEAQIVTRVTQFLAGERG